MLSKHMVDLAQFRNDSNPLRKSQTHLKSQGEILLDNFDFCKNEQISSFSKC